MISSTIYALISLAGFICLCVAYYCFVRHVIINKIKIRFRRRLNSVAIQELIVNINNEHFISDPESEEIKDESIRCSEIV
jgi:hypothetical protein